MDLGPSKVRSALIVAVGAVSSKVGKREEAQHVIFVLEIAHLNGFRVTEILD